MRSPFKAAEKIFSADNHVLIIAEIGTGHNGDIIRAKNLIDASVYAGADAVKFQIVYADEILHPNTGFVTLPTGRISLYERFKALECPKDFYYELADYSRKKGILFAASVFGLHSAEELRNLHPAFIKIASPELNHFPLLQKVATCGLPVILSTGVSLLADIEKALFTLDEKGIATDKRALLHCVTSYPAPETNYNTAVLPVLSTIFNTTVGISDHSLDAAAVPVAAILKGAAIIEKHICLSRKALGLDDPVALEPRSFLKMSTIVRNITGKTEKTIYSYAKTCGYTKKYIEAIIGTGEKKLAESEKNNYGKTNRSLHYMRDLPAGYTITVNDIAILRTEKNLTAGENPNVIKYFIGAVLQKPVINGDGVHFDDIIQRR